MVHIGIGEEISQLVATGVIVQHPETLVTKETRDTWSELVVGSDPSGKKKKISYDVSYVYLLLKRKSCHIVNIFTNLPM